MTVEHDTAAWLDHAIHLDETGVLTGSALRVADGLFCLARRGDSLVFYATTSGIARFSGFSASTTRPIRSAIERLIEVGLVSCQRQGGNKPSIYSLVVPARQATTITKEN